MTGIFNKQVRKHFRYLLEEHGFKICSEKQVGGDALTRMESGKCCVEFVVDWKATEVAIYFRDNDDYIDADDVFLFFTKEIGYSELSYYPYMTMSLHGDKSSDWQLARLANILRPFWPRIIQFVNKEGFNQVDFVLFRSELRDRRCRSWDDEYGPSIRIPELREELLFVEQVSDAFRFLIDDHFYQQTYSSPLVVQYNRESIYICIYHRPISFEIGAHIGSTQLLTEDDSIKKRVDYTVNEFLEIQGKQPNFNHPIAKSSDDVQSAVHSLAKQIETDVVPLLSNAAIFDILEQQRISAAQKVSDTWAISNA